MNEVVIPLKITGIAQMKAELKELKSAIANATDAAQMTALSQKAGELTDKIKDANEAVKVFATGSKFEQVSNGLGGIKDSLMSLDFEEAAEKSKVFATALGGINKADIAKSFKGIADMVGTLSKAFLKLGVTILMNPIFLIVAAVVAIIAVVALVLKSFGVLDDVIKALMAPINALIQAFKDLTDWLGLSAFAAEDNAAKTLAANDKVAASSKERAALVTAGLGREIAEAKAAGLDTTKLEERKSNVQINEAGKRRGYAYKAIADQRSLGEDADQATIKRLHDQINEETEIIKNGYSDKRVAKLTDIKADADAAASAAKAAGDKYRAADKASMDEITAAAKIVSDSKKNAQQIELDDLAAAYKIKIATAIKYKNDTVALVLAQQIETDTINKKYDDAKAAKKAESDAKSATYRLEEAKSLAERLAKLDYTVALDAEEAAILMRNKERKAIEIYYQELLVDAADAKESQKVLDQIEIERMNLLNDINVKYADEKKVRDKEVADNSIAEDKRVYDAKIANIQTDLETASMALNSISSLVNFGLEAKLKGVKKGSKEEEKILRKQFAANKTMQLAMAAINGAQSILAITATAVDPTGITTAIRIAATVIATAASIATIAGTQFNSPASAPSAPDVGAATTAVAVAPAGPQLFGQANTGSQVNAGGGTGNNITVTAVVSETEITASQSHINNIQQNSVL